MLRIATVGVLLLIPTRPKKGTTFRPQASTRYVRKHRESQNVAQILSPEDGHVFELHEPRNVAPRGAWPRTSWDKFCSNCGHVGLPVRTKYPARLRQRSSDEPVTNWVYATSKSSQWTFTEIQHALPGSYMERIEASPPAARARSRKQKMQTACPKKPAYMNMCTF